MIYRAAFNILLTLNRWGQSIGVYPISCGEWQPGASGFPAASLASGEAGRGAPRATTGARDGKEQEEDLDKEK